MNVEEITKKVEEILENQVNPAIAAHGGVCSLVGVKENNNVYLKFGGGCQGCGAVTATLKGGVEQMLRSEVPDINEIIDVTEHEKGENPFF